VTRTTPAYDSAMPHRNRRLPYITDPGVASPESRQRPRARDVFLLIGGIFVFFFSLMIGRMTERAWRIHLNADRYVKTDLEIIHLDETPGDGPRSHIVRVGATGEELIVRDLDARITTKHGPGGAIGRYPPAINAKGRRMPAWYTPDAGGVLSDLRIAYLSEYDSLPHPVHVAKVTLVNLLVLTIGAMMIRTGFRRLKRWQMVNPEHD